jgi:hypothetical protein
MGRAAKRGSRGASRRHVLAGTIVGFGGHAVFAWARPAQGAQAQPLDPRMEPLVRMLERTPREKLLEATAEKIRAGASYRDLLAATLLAGVSSIRARPVGFEFHCVLAVHSAHLAAQTAPAGDRYLPLLWAMDNFKESQETKRRKGDGNWALEATDRAKLPSASRAHASFVQAMDGWDEEAADRAITALHRSAPQEEVRDLMFRYGARDFRDIGHKAIYAANAWRTLQAVGWQHAEPVLRSFTFACLDHEGGNPAQRDAVADRPWRENLERARTVRSEWTQGKSRPEATRELLAVLRKATPGEASAALVALLAARTAPASLWDALFLFAAELVLRHAEIVSLHAVTTMNALHHAYQASGHPRGNRETQLLLLLQAAAFLTMFRDQLDDDYSDGPRIDALATLPTSEQDLGAVTEVFDELGADRQRAARKALGLLEKRLPLVTPALLATANRLTIIKGRGAHDYKFSSAALEDFRHVSPPWRARYLAACVPLLSGTGENDNALIGRARDALGRS